MNADRHDVLYSCARRVLNHNVKRLYFKINPFIERKETLQSRPEQQSRFVQLLQSTVLCENYDFGDNVASAERDAREVKTVDFWDYLYSDQWSKGCALRVLEGDLLDEILTNLFVLHQQNKIAKQKTFAYARNTRERRGCYKLANQKGCGEIEETLLLEFTYYGVRLISEETSTFSSYPESTTSGVISKTSSSETTSGNMRRFNGKASTRAVARSFVAGKTFSPLPPIVRSQSQKSQTFSRPELGTVGEETGLKDGHGSSKTDQTSSIIPLQITERESGLQAIEIIPLEISRESASSQISTENNYRVRFPDLNLEKFRCTEKIHYDDGLNIISEEYVEEKEENENAGEELHLSDLVEQDMQKYEDCLTKLRRHRDELHRKKADLKLRQESTTLKKSSLPKMPDFDIDKLTIDPDEDAPRFKFRFIMTEVPKFEELIYMVDSEEMHDPRFRYVKHLGRKIARRYNLRKEDLHSRTLELASLNTDIKKRFALLQNLNMFLQKKKTAKASKAQKNTRKQATKQPTQSKSARGINVKEKVGRISTEKRLHTDLLAAEVGGVTDSKSCEKHVREQCERKTSMIPEQKSKGLQLTKKMKVPPIILTSASGAISELCEVSTIPVFKTAKTRKILSAVSDEDHHVEHIRLDTDPDKGDRDTDEETITSCFDTSRLNFRYSFERLKGKGYHKKKPAFYEILKKYYRAQKAIDALHNSPFLSPNATGKGKRKSIFQRILDIKTAKPEYKMVIGKLKHFQFLQYKAIPKTEKSETVHFHKSENFRENLLKSLNDFVVRKEHVVSDYCGKTSTTVTFTRKGIFDRRNGMS